MNRKSVLVSYIGNLSHVPSDEVFLVESDSDYVRVCHELAHQATPKAVLKVWVRSRSHFAWLHDFTAQIGCPSDFEEKTARLVLADQWNVTIPSWLTDAVVLDQNLLALKVDSHYPTNFINRLLTHLLKPVFQSDALSAANLSGVVNSLTGSGVKEIFKKYPVLNPCLEAKCKEWAQGSNEDWVKKVCSKLPQQADEIRQWLSLWSLLHGYPERLLEFVLSPQQIALVKKIPVEALNELSPESVAREQALTQIVPFFEEMRTEGASSESFQKVVEYASGRLLKEYELVSGILKDKGFKATSQDVQKVRNKFSSCPGVSSSQLNSLTYCVMPERPALHKERENWTSQEWIRWAVEEYTPYRTWQVYHDYYDEELEQTVKRFSEWYIEKYVSIQKDPDLSLIYALNKVMSADSKEEFVIVLLIDCLPVHFMHVFDDAFRNAGLSRHHLSYRFSPLPTTTACSKNPLLAGRWEDLEKTYESVLKNRAASDCANKNMIYLTNLRELSEMAVPEDPTIAVLNFLGCDELLHSEVEAKNVSYEEEIHRLFTRMAEAVIRLSEAWSGSGELFSVYVMTDHGACRILEKEKESFDSKVVNKLFPDERHRFAVVKETHVHDVPENLWALGYKFRQPFISDTRVYFLPNGHSTVHTPGKAKGYVHGGVTPEEVIVPTALYKLLKVAWKSPAARFLNLNLEKETGRARFYIQRVVNLEIEVQNPNHTDIRVLRVSVLSPETDVKDCETPVIKAESVNTLRLCCYFQKSSLAEKCLEVEFVYDIAGESHTFSLALDSDFKSAMSTGFSLKDL